MHIKKILLAISVGASLSFLTTSCAYRADLVQGNYVEQDLVNQISAGMSTEQVRYVLGSPMLIDPYDKSRWYYINFYREGWSSPDIKRLVLVFNGNTLVDMAGDYKKPVTFNQLNNALNKTSEDIEIPNE
ncbi:MAG: outer membrane protein assembly factor BamE [Succinivibrio sp.]|nr:outer membrane protein assembly factor BamE [Succinivibrio sp.]